MVSRLRLRVGEPPRSRTAIRCAIRAQNEQKVDGTIFGSYGIFFARPGPRNFDRLHVCIETIIDDKGSSRGADTLKVTTLFMVKILT